MKENGLRVRMCVMAVASRYGLMGLATRDTGRATRPTAEEDSSMQTETSMKESGKMIRPTAEESTLTWTAADMKENGLKTNNTDLVLKDGLMVPHMRASTCKERSMARESSHGLITAPTLVTSMTTTSTEQVSMSGRTGASSRESGRLAVE